MRRLRLQSAQSHNRRGTSTVELALVIPVFALFLAGLLEFGHAYSVIHTLNGAAYKAARLGAAEGSTSTETRAMVEQILSKAIRTNHATVYVKDASIFDDREIEPGEIDYEDLPEIELANAESRQLFLVRVQVPYEDVAVLPPFWVKDINLFGQAVMRHE